MDAASLTMLRNLPLARMLEATGAPEARSIAQSLVDQIAHANEGDPEPDGWAEVITPGRFTGKTVIVTGAASGIGRAVASRVAREGGTVIAVDLSAEKLDAVVAAHPGTTIRPVAADITDESAIARIIEATGGRIDALANVAGLSDDFSAIHDVTDDMLERVFNVNVFGLIRLTRAVMPYMLDCWSRRRRQRRLRGSPPRVLIGPRLHGVEVRRSRRHSQHGVHVRAGRHPRQQRGPRRHPHRNASRHQSGAWSRPDSQLLRIGPGRSAREPRGIHHLPAQR